MLTVDRIDFQHIPKSRSRLDNDGATCVYEHFFTRVVDSDDGEEEEEDYKISKWEQDGWLGYSVRCNGGNKSVTVIARKREWENARGWKGEKKGERAWWYRLERKGSMGTGRLVVRGGGAREKTANVYRSAR